VLVLLGFIASSMATYAMYAEEDGVSAILSSSPVSSDAFEAVSAPMPSVGGYRTRARIFSADGDLGEVTLRSKERIPFGERVEGVGTFTANGSDAWGRVSASQGLSGSVKLVLVRSREPPDGILALLVGFREELLERIDPESGDTRALLAGMVCAERSPLEASGVSDAFTHVGLAHMLAVSGAHLSVIAWMLGSMLESLRVRPEPRFAIILAITLLYVLFCAEPVSAIRSWLMSLAGYAGAINGRRSDGLSSLCAVAIVMALFDPSCMGEAGFKLSVASVMGICLLAPYADYALDVLVDMRRISMLLPHPLRRRSFELWNGMRSQMALSASALFLSLPVCIGIFGEVPLASVFVNAVLGPAFNYLIVSAAFILVCSLFAGCASTVLIPVLLSAFDAISSPFIWIVRRVSLLPHISATVLWEPALVWMAAGAVTASILCFWPKVTRRGFAVFLSAVFACLFASSLYWRFCSPARVVVLDVGQGDAIIVQDGPACLLVDTGPDRSLVTALARNRISHLDAVLLTHLHDDHIGGLSSLVGHVSVERVFVAKGVSEHLPGSVEEAIRDLGAELVELSYRDAVAVGDFTLAMLWPIAPCEGDTNADSVILHLGYASDGERMEGLLTGDAERDELAGVLARNPIAGIDLLKVGHHGSEVSLTSAQAERLSPVLSVASAGAGNAYGHPSGTCVDILEETGSVFLCTFEVGDVIIEPHRDGIEVRTVIPP
ncbi:MAG: ComEC/Rec2 family competence protein, partial [Atopobiaceae bacterium]|nr:ComEC/Rec2 family competence protein [Atopobiaceae bacterium]